MKESYFTGRIEGDAALFEIRDFFGLTSFFNCFPPCKIGFLKGSQLFQRVKLTRKFSFRNPK